MVSFVTRKPVSHWGTGQKDQTKESTGWWGQAVEELTVKAMREKEGRERAAMV